ncbi:MAG: DUF6089 family protein [Thermonemataceae bacterium]|nr:DUF6089 family protein [Thermonemataceae bacterium]
MKKVFLSGIFACLSLFASAQMQTKSWSIGAGLGVGNYFGDIVPKANDLSTDIKYTRLSPAVDIAYQFTEQFAVEVDIAWIRLTSSDFETADPRNVQHRYRYMRNLNFRNDLIELAVTGEFDFKPTIGGVFRRPTWRPYVFGGVAVFRHNPKGKTEDGRWVDLQPLRTEGQGLTATTDPTNGITPEYKSKPYSLFSVAIPVGAGIKYKLTDNLDLAFEVGYRYTFTDYIDDVSGNYANPLDLQAHDLLSPVMANRTTENTDAISGGVRDWQTVALETNGTVSDALGRTTINGYGRAGDQRGDAGDKDIYIVTTFRIQYFLQQKGVRCPKFRKARR